MLLQKLAKGYKDWDSRLSAAHQRECEQIRQNLLVIHHATVPRYLGFQGSCQLPITLAGFCDASSLACCVTVYARFSVNNLYCSNLVFAKTRVAPLKKISVPRLELVAMVMGVRATSFVRQQLSLVTQVILFGDSQCVLHWIASSRPQSRFVENRLKEIRHAKVQEFRYVDTKDNPADLGTRGCALTDLKELWWEGPKWLTLPKAEWPEWNPKEENPTQQNDESEKQEIVLQATAVQYSKAPFGIRCEDYSDLGKLFRVTAWCNRWITKVRRQSDTISAVLSAEEITTAQFLWEKHVQSTSFGELIGALANETSHSLKTQLGVRWDSNDRSRSLLRCYGRLAHAELPEGARFPILLPQNHPWTLLVIQFTHEKALHSGVAHTLAQVRMRYWIPRGRLHVKRVIAKCRVCKRHGSGPYALPSMPELPWFRVSVTRPYTFTGLDYFGPLLVKENAGQSKVWCVLFTCLTVRAVHLEIVSDMTTDQFIMALRRFFARCGTPSTIISDNAPQLRAAGQATIGQSQRHPFHDDVVKGTLSYRGVNWRFIPAFAPWQGGFYERMVQLVKRSLRKAIGKAKLTKVQLETYMAEVERVVNSRPLVYLDEDVNQCVITPLSFCRQGEGAPLTSNVDGFHDTDHDDDDTDPNFEIKKRVQVDLIELWKKGESLINEFWKIFLDEYVQSLREKTRYAHQSQKLTSRQIPKIGDVVLVKDLGRSRCTWKIAKIQNLRVSQDGAIRSAKVKTSGGNTWERPINLLVPLECQNDETTSKCEGKRAFSKEENEEQLEKNYSNASLPWYKVRSERVQPSRAAKCKALKAMQDQCDNIND